MIVSFPIAIFDYQELFGQEPNHLYSTVQFIARPKQSLQEAFRMPQHVNFDGENGKP